MLSLSIYSVCDISRGDSKCVWELLICLVKVVTHLVVFHQKHFMHFGDS